MIKLIEDDKNQNEFLHRLKSRGNMDSGSYIETVKEIIDSVRTKGDVALFEYTKKWDSQLVTPANVRVPYESLKEAFESLDKELKDSLLLAKKRIKAFHVKQRQNTWIDIGKEGEIVGQRILPLEKVGVYVPGGKAVYPSSVLMNVLPAKVAGVKKIIMVTPLSAKKGENLPKNVLAAAYIAGVDEVYTIGGAQAIAALAFGTKTIPKVDKIVGPGNIYVALAKREVYGYVSIDSIAGPSEILIIADQSANPTFIAADLLAQAEHDELASCVLITDSRELAWSVKKELTKLYNTLPRQEILKVSLKTYSGILVVKNLKDAYEIANTIAPEHLELMVQEPFNALGYIVNAGAIFLGQHTPESVGDYLAGPNHILPTNGTARFFSPLSVDDFVKKSSLLSFNQGSLKKVEKEVITLANSEELSAHALAVKVRMKEGMV